jgi:hypothetical protein
MSMRIAKRAVLFTLASVVAWAQVNVGEQKPEASLPFTMTTTATFELPWRVVFLPDGRMSVTEKIGPIWLPRWLAVDARRRQPRRADPCDTRKVTGDL